MTESVETPVTEPLEKAVYGSASSRVYIVHVLRTAQQHHVQLSLMADQKANILIGGNLILLTILYAQAGDAAFTPILLVLTITAVLAGTFAVLAVMPKVTVAAPDGGVFNLLFFGHFKQLSLEQYSTRMLTMLEDEPAAYRAMIRDLYQLGKVLDKKYRYLGYSYRCFLLGLSITVVILVIQYFSLLR